MIRKLIGATGALAATLFTATAALAQEKTTKAPDVTNPGNNA